MLYINLENAVSASLSNFSKAFSHPTFRNAIFKRDDEGIEFLPFQVSLSMYVLKVMILFWFAHNSDWNHFTDIKEHQFWNSELSYFIKKRAILIQNWSGVIDTFQSSISTFNGIRFQSLILVLGIEIRDTSGIHNSNFGI